MMPNNILVFGAGSLQLSIINQVKKLGFNAIVIDPDDKAPGVKIADHFFKVAGNDYEGTLRIAREFRVKGIITSATDKPILMMCQIAEKLNLPFPSYKSCETVLDKAKFKTFLKNHKFLYAKGGVFNVKNKDINFEGLKFPLITKPIMNSGSRGVLKCHNKEELNKAIKETIQYTVDGKYLIEEFIEGDEVSIEALVQHGKVHIIQVTDKLVTTPPYNVEIGHVQPSKYINLNPQFNRLLQDVVDKSGLDNCAIHPELKIKGDKITIIEIGPRLGGDFITSHLVPLSTGVNMEELTIKIAIGKIIKIQKKDHFALISYFNFSPNKIISESVLNSELEELFPSIKHFYISLKKGQRINPIFNSLDRYGYFIISDSEINHLLEEKCRIEDYFEKKLLTV